ncbi:MULTISPECIES: hypothetical protein [unclassified Mycolicibacterium]|uniref:Uncharacterized protein n=1 Tax=Mycolicibacterium sp. CBMA 213 TaxID=1968788 RepID=A0A343VRA3_9MYCO|nr:MULTISPECIES: hypothetical protein [unclassified Mycolicibacterium]AVN58427.1 hypothetical protein B5P44_p00132 [Mycolicibacterium sp. CBMA 213]MUL61085.1 hypothetical protein [Mycolicibacterium sp. CBMA 335]
MTRQGNSENPGEAMVRWALGDEVSDENLAEMASRMQEPVPDKSIADLVEEGRRHELKQRIKDLGAGPQ